MLSFFRAFGETFARYGRMLIPYNLREATIIGRMRSSVDVAAESAMQPRRVTGRLLLALQFLLVIGLIVGLYFLNQYLELWRVLRAPSPLFARVWLPLVFALGYVLLWFGYALWKLLGPEGEPVEFPDIEEAWRDGINALLREKIDAAAVPCFLVLGRPTGSQEELFAAASLPWAVKEVPRRADAPVHFYASREGLFITCEGVSLLGRQGTLLASEGSAEPTELTDEERMAEDNELTTTGAFAPILADGMTGDGTQLVGGDDAATNTAMLDAPALPAGLLQTEEAERARRTRPRRPSLLKDKAIVDLSSARLRYLCRKIASLRRPYTPCNGILAVVPLEATATNTDASQTAAILQHDLAIARDALRVSCPAVAVVSDMETAPGFPEVVSHSIAARQRHRLVGQSFPLLPDVEPAELPAMVTSAAQWIGLTLFPVLVYRMLSLEASDEARPTATRSNARLYQLLALLRDRHERMGRIAGRGLATDTSGPPLLGGLYLVANGANRDREHAFAAGAFRQLLDDQNYVSWTRTAVDEDAEYHRMANVGYTLIAVMAAAVVAVGYWYWPIR